MAEIRTVGVKELKNNLSAYLREVRRGTRVLVSDRYRVIAELREPSSAYAYEDPVHPRMAQWMESGTVLQPSAPKVDLPDSPVQLPEGTAERWLDEDRGEAGS